MYLLESYDASDDPDDRYLANQGQFATAAQVLAAARSLIEQNLMLALAAGLSPADAVKQWRESGDVPVIVPRSGAVPVVFDPFAFAAARAHELKKRA
jgi:hypothetical protein